MSEFLNILLFIIFQLTLLTNCQRTPQLIKLLDSDEAKCLDGSPVSYYYTEGDPQKIIFLFQGGAWCGGLDYDSTIEDCYQRAQGESGSSNNLSATKEFNGILSLNPETNQVFYNYTMIFINYCDGTGHQGFRQDPINYKNMSIYFRGQSNTQAIFNHAIKQYNIDQASQVVISGQSAGSLAVYTWIDNLSQQFKILNPNIKVAAIGDCGIFLDFPNYDTQDYKFRQKFINFMNISNNSTPVINKDCQARYSNEIWKCMMVQYLVEFIQHPVFVIESSYDSYSIYEILNINCVNNRNLLDCSPQEREFLDQYANQTQQVVNQFLQKNQISSTWTTTCVDHQYTIGSPYNSEIYKIPELRGKTLEQSLQSFMNGQRQVLLNPVPWPSNLPCSGIQSQYIE